MSIAVLAIDRRARPITVVRRFPDKYDDDGNLVKGREVPFEFRAAIQPASGNQLKDMPEGVRAEAGWIAWSRSEICLNDVITAGCVSYRVLFAWPRCEDGFTRAALGKVKS